jgi:hypothetical protein
MPTTEHIWSGPLPFGFEGGVSTEGDALVSVSNDGVDLNVIWGLIRNAVDAWNAERSALASLLSYATVNAADAVPQATSDESFELATEMGEPESLRAPTSHILMGYTFEDYDKATRYTWRFLRDSTQDQILAAANLALAADNKLVNGTILERLFNPSPESNSHGHSCFGLWSGDSIVPPAYLGKPFAAPHNHYLVSGATDIDSGDLEQAAKLVLEHGYGSEPNSQLLLFVNPEQGEAITSFKAGQVSANDVVAKHDFIPSAGAPAYLTLEQIVGQVAPATYNGLKVQGSYGPLWMIQSDYIPEGYIAVAATYGPNSPNNVIGVRSHPNAAYAGLRVIPVACSRSLSPTSFRVLWPDVGREGTMKTWLVGSGIPRRTSCASCAARTS